MSGIKNPPPRRYGHALIASSCYLAFYRRDKSKTFLETLNEEEKPTATYEKDSALQVPDGGINKRRQSFKDWWLSNLRISSRKKSTSQKSEEVTKTTASSGEGGHINKETASTGALKRPATLVAEPRQRSSHVSIGDDDDDDDKCNH